MSTNELMIFTGNANPKLAQDVADYLRVPLGNAKVGRFSDGEVTVEINENVRGREVFILQSTCAPTNESLMEVLIMADALRRASAGRITAAMPYFGSSSSMVWPPTIIAPASLALSMPPLKISPNTERSIRFGKQTIFNAVTGSPPIA